MPMPNPLMGGAAPKMPGSLSGGPSGPGSSPVTSPGAGAGNEAMADALVKAMIPGLHKALSAYPIGSKKYGACLNAIRALTSNFGKENQQSVVPAALLQLAQANKSGGPMGATPPPPIEPAPMPGPGAGAGLGAEGGAPAPPM